MTADIQLATADMGLTGAEIEQASGSTTRAPPLERKRYATIKKDPVPLSLPPLLAMICNRISIAACTVLAALFLLVPGTSMQAAPAFDSEDAFVRYLHSRMGGEREVTLPDRTRVDLLTPDHAIEVDRSRKWAQAVGQSLHYAAATERQPGIVLLTLAKDRGRYFRRIVRVIETFDLPITLWLLDQHSLQLSRVDLGPR